MSPGATREKPQTCLHAVARGGFFGAEVGETSFGAGMSSEVRQGGGGAGGTGGEG
jgi:hypothetical protein